jgi:hypothetical protein
MRPAAALLCGLLASASAGAAPQVGALEDVCSYVAKTASGPVGKPSDPFYRAANDFTITRGSFDIDDDGKADQVDVGSEGSGAFAYVIINGERAPYIPKLQRDRKDDPAHEMAGTHDIRFLQYKGRWYATWFWVGSPAPAGVVSFSKTDTQHLCTLGHKETEAESYGPAAAPGEIGCNDMRSGEVVAAATDDTLSDADLAALQAAEPRIGRENKYAGCCSFWVEALYRADIDNDGTAERLARVGYLSGGGPGCETRQFRLLPGKGEAAIDETKRIALLRLQGLDTTGAHIVDSGCFNDFSLRRVRGKTVLESNSGTTRGSYVLRRPGKADFTCTKTFNSTVTVSYRGGAQ